MRVVRETRSDGDHRRAVPFPCAVSLLKPSAKLERRRRDGTALLTQLAAPFRYFCERGGMSYRSVHRTDLGDVCYFSSWVFPLSFWGGELNPFFFFARTSIDVLHFMSRRGGSGNQVHQLVWGVV